MLNGRSTGAAAHFYQPFKILSSVIRESSGELHPFAVSNQFSEKIERYFKQSNKL